MEIPAGPLYACWDCLPKWQYYTEHQLEFFWRPNKRVWSQYCARCMAAWREQNARVISEAATVIESDMPQT